MNNSQLSVLNPKISTILWDFDGVILDSMKIKGNGFVELFKNYGLENTKKLKEYHYANGGVSRFEKIRYFYNHILCQDVSEETINKLADKFAKLIEKNLYNKNNLINDSVNYIKENYKQYNFHIVSGAEHNELNSLCNKFDLNQYFITINGSPAKKEILVKNVLEKYNYNQNETILIGDAITDYNAAVKNGIKFYGYNNLELKKYGNYIENFESFLC